MAPPTIARLDKTIPIPFDPRNRHAPRAAESSRRVSVCGGGRRGSGARAMDHGELDRTGAAKTIACVHSTRMFLVGERQDVNEVFTRDRSFHSCCGLILQPCARSVVARALIVLGLEGRA